MCDSGELKRLNFQSTISKRDDHLYFSKFMKKENIIDGSDKKVEIFNLSLNQPMLQTFHREFLKEF